VVSRQPPAGVLMANHRGAYRPAARIRVNHQHAPQVLTTGFGAPRAGDWGRCSHSPRSRDGRCSRFISLTWPSLLRGIMKGCAVTARLILEVPLYDLIDGLPKDQDKHRRGRDQHMRRVPILERTVSSRQ
jgi:hypothetical protein